MTDIHTKLSSFRKPLELYNFIETVHGQVHETLKLCYYQIIQTSLNVSQVNASVAKMHFFGKENLPFPCVSPSLFIELYFGLLRSLFVCGFGMVTVCDMGWDERLLDGRMPLEC